MFQAMLVVARLARSRAVTMNFSKSMEARWYSGGHGMGIGGECLVATVPDFVASLAHSRQSSLAATGRSQASYQAVPQWDVDHRSGWIESERLAWLQSESVAGLNRISWLDRSEFADEPDRPQRGLWDQTSNIFHEPPSRRTEPSLSSQRTTFRKRGGCPSSAMVNGVQNGCY